MTEQSDERILVVDDDAGMRRAMSRILAALYPLDAVGSFGEALERLEAGDYAVALIDIRLGDGDGYSLCREVRKRSPETDVILVTGSLTQPDEKLYRSLEENAFYFLFKPFERRVLRALVERCLRLQRERRAKEAFAAALSQDLERARRFQHSLLPRRPLAQAGWRAEGRFEPCDALGGDFYTALVERDGSVVAGIADVVGHGVSAAMYAGMLRSTLDAARRIDPDPASVAEELLRGVDFFDGARYATFVYARLDPLGSIRYFNAGHPPLLRQRSNGRVEHLESTGVVLSSVFRDRPQAVAEIEVEPQDRLLLYTDGASEARDPQEGELGVEGLVAILGEAREMALGPALDHLQARVREHCGGRPLEDDVTLLLIERTG